MEKKYKIVSVEMDKKYDDEDYMTEAEISVMVIEEMTGIEFAVSVTFIDEGRANRMFDRIKPYFQKSSTRDQLLNAGLRFLTSRGKHGE